MSHPTEDELVDLAVSDEAIDPSISTHVNACDECSATVAELRHTSALLASAPGYAAWQPPAEAVWGRISDQLDTDDLSDERRGEHRDDLNDDLSDDVKAELAGKQAGDLAGTAADDAAPLATAGSPATPATPHTDDELGARRARAEARTEARSGRGRDRGRGRAIGWGAGLAAASLAIGLLAGRAIWQPETPPQPVAQVALSTLDTKQDEGEATVVRSDQGLDLTGATTSPRDAGDGYLEVWLLNADGQRMVSVGVLPAGDQGSFPISQSLIDEGYVIVDISQERFDDAPTHSGDSLLRGKLPA